jgi:hypothetical protein
MHFILPVYDFFLSEKDALLRRNCRCILSCLRSPYFSVLVLTQTILFLLAFVFLNFVSLVVFLVVTKNQSFLKTTLLSVIEPNLPECFAT